MVNIEQSQSSIFIGKVTKLHTQFVLKQKTLLLHEGKKIKGTNVASGVDTMLIYVLFC